MPSTRRALPFILLVLAAVLVAASPAAAASPADPNSWCGTHPLNLPIFAAQHQAYERQLARQRLAGSLPEKAAPVVFQSGNVAVIEDDGSIVRRPNLFDLAGRAMQILRRPKGITVVRSPLDVKDFTGDKLPLGDDDAIEIDFPAGFTFPFGDQVYASVWVHSDGNLTFGEPDAASAQRSLSRLIAGPPRLAPLFSDLDPSAAGAAGGVYVDFPPLRVRVTWREVPIFGDDDRINTFQVTLFSNGRAVFAYGDRIMATEAVVGVAPFGTDDVQVLNYDVELPFRPPQRVAIAEAFTESMDVDLAVLSQTFLQHFEDAYDFLAVWEDFSITLLQGNAFAFASTIKNDVRGIGQQVYDGTAGYGSSGRLQTILQMGWINKYSTELGRRTNRTYDSMGILAHEAGHRWLSFPRIIEGNGARTNRLIGAGGSHWSFFVDTDGSLMEGNDYDDVGGGDFRITARTTTHFSDLDQYLMGLLPPAQVADFFYIDNPDAFDKNDVTLPDRIGLIVGGNRVNARVEDVIAAEGPRIPAAAAAPKNFRIAFILLTRPGQHAAQASIDRLETLRGQFLGYFQGVTDNRATVGTALVPK